MRLGIIDIGSNTSKAIIVENDEGHDKGKFKVLDQCSLPCRILSNANGRIKISDHQRDLLITTLLSFKEFFSNYHVDQIHAFGTEALRKAENSALVLKSILQESDIAVRVLSGVEEAQAIACGLRTDPELAEFSDYFALDLGGGSLEILAIKNGKVCLARSLCLGAVAVASASTNDTTLPLSSEVLAKTHRYVQAILEQELFDLQPTEIPFLIGSGGTLVFLRKLLTPQNQATNQTNLLTLKNTEKMLREISSLSLDQRHQAYPDLPQDRADIFPFGLITLVETMKYLEKSGIIHSFHNLRHGLAWQILNK